ncbi:MAG: polymer-forming cytoskeletal protein [Alphaproteobacteria bacterium]
MFSKVRNARDSARDGRATPPSIVSTDMRITGNIVTTGEVQVDGTVEGDVTCKTLVIGPTGTIRGEVDADVARIHGYMSGQLRATSVFLASSAQMVGDVTHVSLAIEPGALMDGHCRHVKSVGETGEPSGEPGESLMLTDGSRRLRNAAKVVAPVPDRPVPDRPLPDRDDDRPAIAAVTPADVEPDLAAAVQAAG